MPRRIRQSEERYYKQVTRRRERRYNSVDSEGDEYYLDDDDHDHGHHGHGHGSRNRDFYSSRRPGNGHVKKFDRVEEPSGPQMMWLYPSPPNAALNGGCQVISCTTEIPGWKHVPAPPCINGQYFYGPPPPPEEPKPFTLKVIDQTDGSRWYRYAESYEIEVSPQACGHDIVSWILSRTEDVDEYDVYVRWTNGGAKEPLDYDVSLDELRKDCQHLIVQKKQTGHDHDHDHGHGHSHGHGHGHGGHSHGHGHSHRH